jgi:diguanylate cyclase (GGDEF)-like protein
MLMDVDHFKAINDRRGHAAGDQVLSALGSMLGTALRKCDIGARWGGEEFVVSLTSTDLQGGRVVAERVRLAIERLVVRDAGGERIPVTASVGLAALRANEDLHVLIDRADRAMYAAKVAGRNRLVVDDQPAEPLDAVDVSHTADEGDERSEAIKPSSSRAWSS